MPIPTDAEQLKFLGQFQRLLDEGLFSATYKFALIRALADLAVELGDDSGNPLPLAATDIAPKFITTYWRQVIPPPKADGASLLWQNNDKDKQAAIVGLVADAHQRFQGSLARCQSAANDWGRLTSKVAQAITKMPLWKLQTVGAEPLEFLYPNLGKGGRIELFGVAVVCLRRFHALVVDAVETAWLRWIRRLPRNRGLLGETLDLHDFMFGSERENLDGYRAVLRDVQGERCFYCEERLVKGGAVDHFIPWSRYSHDLGHNFVLADGRCNGSKSDRLAAPRHLERWAARNAAHGASMALQFTKDGLPHDIAASRTIARWAYSQAWTMGALTWDQLTAFFTSAEYRGRFGPRDRPRGFWTTVRDRKPARVTPTASPVKWASF